MNARLHPLVVVLVLFLAGVAIAVWMWGTGEAKEIGGPSALDIGPDGHLYIQIQNRLLEHDADGVFLRQHDLSSLGVEVMLGDIRFFSNGDILIRRGPDPRTLSQNLRAYKRLENNQSLTPTTRDTGLYRCNLDAARCERFGSEGIDFKAAHSTFIDRRTDDVYISDTTRHLLRKYSANGEVLADPAGGFKFPNQLLMHNDHLYVASTNQHQVHMIDPRTEFFGRKLESFSTQSPAAIAAGRIWPSHVARVGDAWWVNNMRNTMSEGGIYIFDDEWRFESRVRLPPNADPISILPFQDFVLISDWNNDRIYRISESGEVLGIFVSSGLEEVLADSRARRLQHNLYAYTGVALFAFVFFGLAIRAITTRNADHRGRRQPD